MAVSRVWLFSFSILFIKLKIDVVREHEFIDFAVLTDLFVVAVVVFLCSMVMLTARKHHFYVDFLILRKSRID